jgi:Zn-dependent protease
MTGIKKYALIFGITCCIMSALFFLIPINLFDGEITFAKGTIERTVEAKLSLSYFIGIGASKADLQDVKEFHLLPMGYFFAFLMLFALPGLVAYRFYLSDENKKLKQKKD